MQTIYVDRKDPTVLHIIQAAFPTYNGQRIKILITDSVVFHNTLWSGGQRSVYKILDLNTNQVVELPPEQFMTVNESYHKILKLPDNLVVVELIEGNRESLIIHANKDKINPRLENNSLTRNERVVLSATRGFKSSYGGISNYRFYEANRETGISLEDWNLAKEALTKKGLLNKVGAITNDGRNAIGNVQLHQLK